MGFFDKKYCDVCGSAIGMLGNRKLDDGNLCKNCAKKLSPWFEERRHSTVEEIKKQLEYREANKEKVQSFQITRDFGSDRYHVYVDDNNQQFAVATGMNKEINPDILDLSQVTSCRLEIKQNREELQYKDKDGKMQDYNPPRYKYSYDYLIKLSVNSPWFDDMDFQLNSFSVEDQDRGKMMDMENLGNQIVAALTGNQYMPQNGMMNNSMYGQQGGMMNNNMYGQQGGMMNNGMYGQQGGMMNNGMYGQQGGMMNNGMYGQQNGMMNNGMYSQQGKMMNNGMYGQQGGMMNNGMYGAAGAVMGTVMGAAGAAGAARAVRGTQNQSAGSWRCSCGTVNTARFCHQCGQPRPVQTEGFSQTQTAGYGQARMVRCDKCGWVASDLSNVPKFCPNCGDPIDQNDMR
ncbi:MAG: DUF4428 domain-containing protein [Enterocloster sp.]